MHETIPIEETDHQGYDSPEYYEQVQIEGIAVSKKELDDFIATHPPGTIEALQNKIKKGLPMYLEHGGVPVGAFTESYIDPEKGFIVKGHTFEPGTSSTNQKDIILINKKILLGELPDLSIHYLTEGPDRNTQSFKQLFEISLAKKGKDPGAKILKKMAVVYSDEKNKLPTFSENNTNGKSENTKKPVSSVFQKAMNTDESTATPSSDPKPGASPSGASATQTEQGQQKATQPTEITETKPPVKNNDGGEGDDNSIVKYKHEPSNREFIIKLQKKPTTEELKKQVIQDLNINSEKVNDPVVKVLIAQNLELQKKANELTFESDNTKFKQMREMIDNGFITSQETLEGVNQSILNGRGQDWNAYNMLYSEFINNRNKTLALEQELRKYKGEDAVGDSSTTDSSSSSSPSSSVPATSAVNKQVAVSGSKPAERTFDIGNGMKEMNDVLNQLMRLQQQFISGYNEQNRYIFQPKQTPQTNGIPTNMKTGGQPVTNNVPAAPERGLVLNSSESNKRTSSAANLVIEDQLKKRFSSGYKKYFQ